jgi:Major Facilitator Superfamily
MNTGALSCFSVYTIVNDIEYPFYQNNISSHKLSQTGCKQQHTVNFRKNAAGVPSSQSQVQFFPILLINFIGTLGFSIVLPFLVFLVEDFGGNAIVFGILSAIYPAFQLIGAPILGKWSDTYGRKNTSFK